MKKEILIIGIIFLFVGVGIQPAFAVENISINRPSSENIEDCNCQVDDNNLVRLERLSNRIDSFIDRVETCNKLMPILYKDNPEVKVEYEKLLNDIDLFEEIYADLENNIPVDGRPICNMLKNLRGKTLDKSSYYANLGARIYLEENNWILASILISISFIYFLMHVFINIIYSYLLCNLFPLN